MKTIIIAIGMLLVSQLSRAENQLPKQEIPEPSGVNIGQAISSESYVENMIGIQQALMDLQASQPFREYEIRYNSAGYVEEIIFNDGKILSFDYTADGAESISRVSVSFNGQRFLSVESEENGNNDPNGVELTQEALDAITNFQNSHGESFHLLKKTDPETFLKFVAGFKKSAIGSKTDYKTSDAENDPHPEQIFKSLKTLFSDLQHGQKKALEIYSRKIVSEEIRSGSAASREIHETSELPSKVLTVAAEAVPIRSDESPREALESSIEKCLMRFTSRLETIIPGRTVISVNGDVTEILLVLPQPEPA